MGRGSPFLDLDKLRPGDPIVVETRTSWFVYRVLGDAATGNFGTDPSGIPGQEIVLPTDVSVISPDPGRRRRPAAPAASYLTLTTCHPRFSARQRLVIHAKLDGAGTDQGRRSRTAAGAARLTEPPDPRPRGPRCTAGSGATCPAAPALKAAQSLALVLVVAALLLFVVFPLVEPYLPFNSVTVDR